MAYSLSYKDSALQYIVIGNQLESFQTGIMFFYQWKTDVQLIMKAVIMNHALLNRDASCNYEPRSSK